KTRFNLSDKASNIGTTGTAGNAGTTGIAARNATSIVLLVRSMHARSGRRLGVGVGRMVCAAAWRAADWAGRGGDHGCTVRAGGQLPLQRERGAGRGAGA